MTDDTRALLALASAKGLGPRTIKVLVEHLGDGESVLSASEGALKGVPGIGPAAVRAVREARRSVVADEVQKKAQRLGVTVLGLTDPHYPPILRMIYDPPTVLYVRGALPATFTNPVAHVKAVGVVGTRNASEYALRVTESLAKDLAAARVVVVSGLALGVDSAAHKGALAAQGGQTVAVLGSGVDVIYPRQNQALAKQIAQQGGAVISEYALGTSPHARNFPGRNRIINGLCQGVVVVEAGEKSGALITSDYASNEGRTVFAIPGRIGDPNSKGSLSLLKQGAALVENAQDILNEFDWQAQNSQASVALPDLTDVQTSIMQALQSCDEARLDALISQTGLDASELLTQLTLLELLGLVRLLPGGRYARSV